MASNRAANYLASARHPPSAGVAVVLISAAWFFGAANAIRLGFDPGYWAAAGPHPYPFAPTALVLLVISAETGILFALVRPASFYRSWLRLLAVATFVASALWLDLRLYSGGHDLAGYIYANSAFLLVALLVLSLAFAMQMLEAGHSYPEAAQASRSGNSVLSNWR